MPLPVVLSRVSPHTGLVRALRFFFIMSRRRWTQELRLAREVGTVLHGGKLD
jgi:hypothetical protein